MIPAVTRTLDRGRRAMRGWTLYLAPAEAIEETLSVVSLERNRSGTMCSSHVSQTVIP